MVDDFEKNLLSRVTHDLRTPLAVVHTTTSMLLNPKYQLSPEQVREQHERIRRNVELMNRMIADLSDVVTLRSGALPISPTRMMLDAALGDAVAAQEAAARDTGVVLSFGADSDVAKVDADPTRLAQLFQILIGHAVKSGKAGETVTVSRRTQGSRAQIAISDRGAGMAREDLPHVFDPTSSAGLGLSIAKGIVEAHGGEIRCHAEPGAGTTFEVTLPLA